MPTLKSFTARVLFVVALFATILAAFLSVGLLAGYVLNLLVPSIELGTATLCGLVAVAIMVHCLFKLSESYSAVQAMVDDDESEEDDELMLSDEQVDVVVEQLTEAIALRAWANSEEFDFKTKRRQRR